MGRLFLLLLLFFLFWPALLLLPLKLLFGCFCA